mgnify:CR=1 FL=1
MALRGVVALVGNPNSGKTALFNALTGAHQKVANYADVTVERKEGLIRSASGRTMTVLDLPGTYSLRARSPDEEVTRDAVLGKLAGEEAPDVLVCVADATNLRLVLRLILELKAVGRPMVLALNMYDIAQRQGLRIDLDGLRAELGVPIITTVATRKRGIESADIVMPSGSTWSPTRVELWNTVEAKNKRADAQVAREFLVALPDELDAGQRRRLAVDFAQELADRYGIAADVAIHPPGKEGDQRNHHAHILTTTNRVEGDGFGNKERELDLVAHNMGGGVGVGGHAGHRVVGDTTQVAMPESGIGMIPDVGGTWLLARAPGRIGRLGSRRPWEKSRRAAPLGGPSIAEPLLSGRNSHVRVER